MKDLQTIVAETLSIENELVKDSLDRALLHSWDSFNHLVLISEIEKQLEVSFTMDEVVSIQNYLQLRELVEGKLKSAKRGGG
jgi:acyl carrier protein